MTLQALGRGAVAAEVHEGRPGRLMEQRQGCNPVNIVQSADLVIVAAAELHVNA